MIEVIEELEKKGFRVSVYPRCDRGEWYWAAGVYIGENTKAHWVNSENGLPHACYSGYREALEAVVNYCNNGKKNKKG